MPIYEYLCKTCGHQFDALQKISDDPLTDCPECGRPELKKLLSAPNFRLKGAGWYETDFKADNRRNLAESTEKKDAQDGKGLKSDGGDAPKKGKADKAADSTSKPSTKTGESGAGKSKGGKSGTI